MCEWQNLLRMALSLSLTVVASGVTLGGALAGLVVGSTA